MAYYECDCGKVSIVESRIVYASGGYYVYLYINNQIGINLLDGTNHKYEVYPNGKIVKIS